MHTNSNMGNYHMIVQMPPMYDASYQSQNNGNIPSYAQFNTGATEWIDTNRNKIITLDGVDYVIDMADPIAEKQLYKTLTADEYINGRQHAEIPIYRDEINLINVATGERTTHGWDYNARVQA